MKDDGTVEDSSYEGSDKFSICFEELASLSSPVCMYWDDVKSYWSTEGVTLNTESNKFIFCIYIFKLIAVNQYILVLLVL